MGEFVRQRHQGQAAQTRLHVFFRGIFAFTGKDRLKWAFRDLARSLSPHTRARIVLHSSKWALWRVAGSVTRSMRNAALPTWDGEELWFPITSAPCATKLATGS